MSTYRNWSHSASKVRLLYTACLVATAVSVCGGQLLADELATRDSRIEWWRDARFGMFVHWGLYSGLAGEWDGKSLGSSGNMEWIQQRAKVDTDVYAEQAIPRFKPKPGFATEWATLAKAAGCKYLVFTTKHHEGFALHDSKVSDFDAGSVLQRDLVKEIVEACRKEGLRVGFYYSLIDWHHDQFAYADSSRIPHPLRGQPYPNGPRDQAKYIEFLHQQVDELVTNYGPVDILWWDFSVPDFQGKKAWDAFTLMELVRQKQPSAIMNNRLFRIPESGSNWSFTHNGKPDALFNTKYGDFVTPEQHVPDTGIPGVDWETCMTMNSTWGFSKHDHNWKSPETILHILIDAVSKGGNFLINVGPKANGEVPQQSVDTLREIGAWMKVNGESIYGTTASPVENPDWGRITMKRDEKAIYLHVFDWPNDGRLVVKALPDGYSMATLLSTGQEVASTRNNGAIVLDVSDLAPAPLATVIKLQRTTESKDGAR
jgi:alpha-L-fucosidase